MSYLQAIEYWRNKEITNAAELEAALNGQIINFAYHSGKIENSNITYDDTREIFETDTVSSYTGDLRTLFEIRNSKDAIYKILDAFDKKMSITEDFIKEVQYELTKNTYDARRWSIGERPGTYKLHDYIVGMNEVGASAEDTPKEMMELLSDITNTTITDKNILNAAAYFHCKMENIHPFSDGNGRTGRLLVNYFLVQHNHPPMIIFNEDKKTYSEALREWDIKQSISAMVDFMKFEISKTWGKQLEK